MDGRSRDFCCPVEINDRGRLALGGCDLVDLAETYDTPLYAYDEAALRAACRRYRDALAGAWDDGLVVYAAKAFLVLAMARLVAEEDLGLDVVSGGELHTALRAGFPPERIYFHGNNKAPWELAAALEHGVGRVVVDNLDELALLSKLAGGRDRPAPIALRVTPGVEADTHAHLRTGHNDSKFGLRLSTGEAYRAVELALDEPGLDLVGLHAHIGSQIMDLAPFTAAARTMVAVAAEVRRHTGWTPAELNLGGGLGVPYLPGERAPTPEDFVATVALAVGEACDGAGLPRPRLVLEPGRSIVAPAAVALYRVGAVRELNGDRVMVAVDGGMADNPRPTLYGARYQVVPAGRPRDPAAVSTTVVGRYCESGDVLARNVPLPRLQRGEVVAFLAAGAYQVAMASNYNRFPRPAVVFCCGGRSRLVQARETLDDLLARDRL